MAGFLSENRPIRTLREILNRLRETYCGNIGFEVRCAKTALNCFCFFELV
jgi:2-oxoglutarate dehydrogenase complex dehydrogenase (E1) component-like enzyme